MFAPAATYEVPVDRLGEARDAFASAIASIRESPG